jgi:hypothetical protein
LSLGNIDRSFDHIASVKLLSRELAPPSVQEHLAAIFVQFNWLFTGQLVRLNSAPGVRARVEVRVSQRFEAKWTISP